MQHVHISEGVLSLPVLASGGAVAIIGLAFGIRRLDPNDIPKTALLTAAFFLASLVHVPIGPSSVHLILNGLLGVLLGWAAFPAIFTALVLQAVLFQFGGLTTLGVNTVIMAGPAIFFGLPVRLLIVKKAPSARTVVLAAGAAGAFSILGSGLLAAASLALSGEAFSGVARLILLAHLPVAGIEAVITSISVAALLRMRPEMILPGHGRMSVASGFALIAVLAAGDAEAHRLNVFAWDSGDLVRGEVYFADGTPVSGARIEAACPDGVVVFSGVSAIKGAFSFPAPCCSSVRIVADAGMGHRAETTLELAETLRSVPERGETLQPSSVGIMRIDALTPSAVEAILDERLEPIRQELARLARREDRVRLRDVVAGLGFISGAAGLALYLAAKRERKKNTPVSPTT